MEFSEGPLLIAGSFLAVCGIIIVVLGEIGLREIKREERDNEKHHG